MDKPIVTHRLSLNMDSLAVQATITLAQFDTATHRLIVDLRHGSEIVELPPGSYAIAVQNTEAGVDVLDSVTVYGAEGSFPNSIVYDVTTAVTEKEGYHEACFMISFVNEHGEVCSLASPRIAFVVKPDVLRSSEIEKSEPYAAVVEAQKEAQSAQRKAEEAKAAAEAAKAAAEAVGMVEKVSLTAANGLCFEFADGREIETDSVQGPRGFTGPVGPRGATGQRGTKWFWSSADPVGAISGAQYGDFFLNIVTGDVFSYDMSKWNFEGCIKGEAGKPFRIEKVYSSVSAMNAGCLTDGVPDGSFVLIATGSVEDAENARLYVKAASAYRYLCDLSGEEGARGIQGPPGADGKDGEDGVSPTVRVTEVGNGYTVQITDQNGTKSFQLLHGKDGDGGGADERRSTLLCDAVLGWRHYGEGNYEMYAEMPLADTILPRTDYIVNGTQVTSDESGHIEQEVTMNYGQRGVVQLSGKTARLLILSEYDPYDECTVRVTVVGPGARTCVAQLTALGAIGGGGWDDSKPTPTVDVLSLLPYRIVYLIREDGTYHTAVLDGDGNLPAVNVNTTDEPLLVSITDDKLTVDGKGFTMTTQGVTLTVLAETLDVGDGGGSSTSGSGSGAISAAEVWYAPQNGYLTWKIPANGTHLVKIEGTSSARRWIVVEDGYVKHDSDPYNSYGISVNVEGNGLLWIYPESQAIYLKFEPIDRFKISCFIEGTPVLLRDPSTLELYEKPIEQVLPFEYAAFWNPEKGRLDATRVLAPPIAGDAEEFDRLYFDNGTELDVYGVQFFWNVDTDTLVDWAKMEPGTRVCTAEGEVVCFVRSEHIVPEAPVKHYTLLTYRGRYIAGGIVAGDKRDLIYPRLMAPERVRYWRMLSEKDQDGLVKAHREGCRRRNWKYSRELHDALDPLKRRRRELESRIGERKQYLADTDHRVIKFTEGVIDEAAFAPDRAARAEARTDINRDEVEIVAVDGQIKAETERVRAEIAATWRPKYAGRFVGKNKVILEDEQ